MDDRDKQIYFGAEASETNLRVSLGAGTPRVLHLATHGLIDPVEPVSSSVVLSPDTVTGDDGYLHTLEILSMPFDVELVVLSACESASGTLERGEGVVGLCRAFMASGGRGVVASLWAVSDESTAKLMTVFYEEMYREKRPAAVALSAARRSLIEDPVYSHPFYWSPFVLTGTVKTK